MTLGLVFVGKRDLGDPLAIFSRRSNKERKNVILHNWMATGEEEELVQCSLARSRSTPVYSPRRTVRANLGLDPRLKRADAYKKRKK